MQRSITIPKQTIGQFTQEEIQITLVKQPEELQKILPRGLYKTFLDLHEKAQVKPKEALKEIKKMHKTCPDCDELTNLLTYVYLRCKKFKLATNLIITNYQSNPSSLIAKINYADYCLRHRCYDEIPKIFNHCYDLRQVAPEQKNFSFVVYRGFLNVMGHYHLAIGKKEIACHYHLLSHKFDPEHAGTRLLGKKLYKLPWWKALFYRRETQSSD